MKTLSPIRITLDLSRANNPEVSGIAIIQEVITDIVNSIGIEKIKKLNLSGNQLDFLPEIVGRLQLKEIDITGNNIDDNDKILKQLRANNPDINIITGRMVRTKRR